MYLVSLTVPAAYIFKTKDSEEEDVEEVIYKDSSHFLKVLIKFYFSVFLM